MGVIVFTQAGTRLSRVDEIEELGVSVVPNVLNGTEIEHLVAALSTPDLRRSRAGVRHALGVGAIGALASEPRLMTFVRPILGNGALPFRATVFEKSPSSNWLVVWHQDTALPLRARHEVAGWGPWSVKDGINYAHAPANALCKVLALRVHLDDSDLANGPLRVLPGTHKSGVLTDDQIGVLARQIPASDCIVRRGGIVLMRPLAVHASSKSSSAIPRRVVHIEYTASLTLEKGLELAIV